MHTPAQSTVKNAFLGCGNLGMAILTRGIQAGVIRAADTVVIETSEARRIEAAALGVTASELSSTARQARFFLLAVKPQHFAKAAQQLGPLDQDVCVVSVMAGWSSAAIQAELGGAPRVIRAMPNTPARIGCAMTAVARGVGATADDLAKTLRIFSAIGRAVEIDESQIDGAVAAIGSAPAYLYYLAESQIAAAIHMGFDHATARLMAIESILGAATLLAQDGRTPEELRKEVTSAGGTTAAAIKVMEDRGFKDVVMDAMNAARARSAELGK